MKIEFTITTHIGSLTHRFVDEKLVAGFQQLEDMLGEKADPIPRTIMLTDYLKKNDLWGKLYDDYFVTKIQKTTDGEHWYFTKTLN